MTGNIFLEENKGKRVINSNKIMILTKTYNEYGYSPGNSLGNTQFAIFSLHWLKSLTSFFFFNSFFYQEWLLHIIIRLAKNTHLPVQIAFLHFGPTTREKRAKTARTLIIIINNFKMKFMKCIFQLKFPSSSLVEVNMLTFKAQCINEWIFF